MTVVDPCNAYSTEASCYIHRAECKYVGSTCVSGAPSTCAEYNHDYRGCGTQLLCEMVDGSCVNANQAGCASYLTSSACNIVPQCYWNAGTCANGPAPTTCKSHSTESNCLSDTDGCIWFSYLSRCFESYAEINALFPCTGWGPYESPSTPCIAADGCHWTDTQCFSDGSTDYTNTDTEEQIQCSSVVDMYNAIVVPETLILQLTVSVPLTWDLAKPAWPIIGAGDSFSAATAPLGLNYDMCPNLNNLLGDDPVVVTHSDSSVLETYTTTWINAAHNLDFESNTNGIAARGMFGSMGIGEAWDIVTYVETETVGSDTNVIYTVKVPLVNSTCFGTGVTTTVTQQDTTFVVPISFIQRKLGCGVMKSTGTFIAVKDTTGSVTVSATSIYRKTTKLIEASELRPTRTADGAKRATFVFQLDYLNVGDGTIRVGPRTISDISTSFTTGTPTNCYGLTVTGYNFLGCTSNTCSHQVTVTTRFVIPQADGTTLKYCSYQPDADRITDMGSDIAYPTELNEQIAFTVDSWYGPIADINDPSYVKVNQASNNDPDQVSAGITLSIFPDGDLGRSRFSVSAGIFTDPAAALEDVTVLATKTTSGTTTGTDARNVALKYDESLGVVLFGTDATVRVTHQLKLLLDLRNITLTGVDTVGTPVTGDPIYWDSIDNKVSYVPKLDKETRCPLCATNGVCTGYSHCDSFMIPVSSLRPLLPTGSVGVQFDLTYIELLGGGTGAFNLNPGRRLLSIGEDEALHYSTFTITTYWNGTVTSEIVIPINPINTNPNITTLDTLFGNQSKAYPSIAFPSFFIWVALIIVSSIVA